MGHGGGGQGGEGWREGDSVDGRADEEIGCRGLSVEEVEQGAEALRHLWAERKVWCSETDLTITKT